MIKFVVDVIFNFVLFSISQWIKTIVPKMQSLVKSETEILQNCNLYKLVNCGGADFYSSTPVSADVGRSARAVVLLVHFAGASSRKHLLFDQKILNNSPLT